MLLLVFPGLAILKLPGRKDKRAGRKARKKKRTKKMVEKKTNRIRKMVFGVLCIGIGSGLFRYAGFGADPFTTMNLGISSLLNLSFGTWQLIMNIVLFLPVLFWGRKTVGWGTAANMVFVGYLSDASLSMMNSLLDESTLVMRLMIMIVAMVIASFGVACYIVPELGVAPYDALQLMIEQHSKGKISYRAARIGCDSLCIVIGIAALLAAGGKLFSLVGIGTICNVLMMGPVIQFFKERMMTSKLQPRLPEISAYQSSK